MPARLSPPQSLNIQITTGIERKLRCAHEEGRKCLCRVRASVSLFPHSLAWAKFWAANSWERERERGGERRVRAPDKPQLCPTTRTHTHTHVKDARRFHSEALGVERGAPPPLLHRACRSVSARPLCGTFCEPAHVYVYVWRVAIANDVVDRGLKELMPFAPEMMRLARQ